MVLDIGSEVCSEIRVPGKECDVARHRHLVSQNGKPERLVNDATRQLTSSPIIAESVECVADQSDMISATPSATLCTTTQLKTLTSLEPNLALDNVIHDLVIFARIGPVNQVYQKTSQPVVMLVGISPHAL